VDFAFSDAQQRLHERMRELGREVSALPRDERMAALAAGGALGLCIDPRYGGGGHGMLGAAHAYEGLGRELDDGGLLLAAGAHLFGVAATVQRLGNDAQRGRWLPRLADGTCIATVAATEADSGSDIGAVAASVEPSDDGAYLAAGDKRYVTFAEHAGLFLFVGRRPGDRGLTVALLPRDCGTVEAGDGYQTLGLGGARLAPVRFRDCRLDADDILGRPGAGMAAFQCAMTHERALVLAFRLGAMQRELDESLHFARRRKLASKPISEHQAVSHRLAGMKRRLETARLLSYRAAWLLDAGKRGQSAAALAKWHLAEAAVDNALDALRLRGGAGYLRSAGLGATLDDTLGGAIHSGTADVLAGIVAAWLGVE
jgi:alkylation response protein AidB-like acyl-CoA dehydrogenase